MTTWYKVSIEVSAEKLEIVTAVLRSEGRSLSVTEIEGGKKNPLRKRGTHAPRSKDRPSRHAIILAALAQGDRTNHQLGFLLKAQGYSETSANPTTSDLVSSGQIYRVGAGLYSLNKPAEK